MANGGLKSWLKRYGIRLIFFWTVVIGFLAQLNLSNHHDDVLKGAETEARDYFRLNLFYRAWAARMGGVYVAADKVTPNPYLRVPDRDLTAGDNRRLTLVNPAYMTRMVFDSMLTSAPDPIINKITSLKPLNPQNAPDQWERQSLEAFDRKEYGERFEVTNISGKPYLRLISMFVTEASCLKCHAHQGYRIGDVRGGITISVPMSRRFALQRRTDVKIMGGYLLLWMLGSAGIAVASRRRSLADEALVASERMFRTVCDWTQDWEYWVAPDGAMRYVSPSCREVTGYTREEFLDDPGLVKKIVHPDYFAGFAEHHLAGSAPEADIAELIEFPIVMRDGSVRWMQHLCRPIYDGAAFLGRRASNRDITEKRRADDVLLDQAARLEEQVAERQMAQEALQEQAVLLEEEIAERRLAEEKLRIIFDAAQAGIIMVDAKGIVTFANRSVSRLYGREAAEMLGSNYLDHVPADEYRAAELSLKRLIQGSIDAVALERRYLRGDGSEFWGLLNGKRHLDENGRLISIIFVITDITELRHAQSERDVLQKKFNQAQKMEAIGRLAGGIAHDFNNKLSVIMGYAEILLLKGDNLDEVQVGRLREIQKAAGHSCEITRQLLAFSRSESISPQKVDLNGLIEDSRKSLSRLIGEDIKFEFHPAQELWPTKLDPTQVDQIIMNLAVNARDAMPDGGSFSIETANAHINEFYVHEIPNAPPGDYVQVTVSDTGFGMNAEILGHIFEPFFTTKEAGKGTGLGLATIYGIVTQNRGFLNVYSEVGLGTTFKIFFPRMPSSEGVAPAVKKSESTPSGSGSVLLVEDEEALRRMAAEMLGQLGYGVVEAASPAEAIELCGAGSRREIDLLLTDVVMPEMNGKEMYDAIRALRPDLPALFMSGFTADVIASKGILGSSVHLIQKPFNLHELSIMVQKAMGNRAVGPG